MRSTSKNLEVIYEDNHIIAINKRPGDIVQGDKTGDIPLSEIVKLFLKEKYGKTGNVYLGVVHRLDRPSSGIVIFSKTSKALPRLNQLFAEKKTIKTYWAIIKGVPPKTEASLENWMLRDAIRNKSKALSKQVPKSKKAILTYKLVKSLDRYSLLEIILQTGRHHQIRAQLSAIGCPIKGDLKYGFSHSNKDGGIHLHARKLEFVHPVSQKCLKLIASPPKQDTIWNACL